jgi:PKD repeat protein
VAFTNTTSPAPASVQWDFGDGTTSTTLNPLKTYQRTGTFTVRLISSFGGCADTATKQVTISAKPEADFTVQQQTFCSLPATANFTALANGGNDHYAWDFGDGTTATTATPTHTYTKQGTYTVRLIVTNEGGCSDTVVKKDFIEIQKPDVTIKGLPRNGCVPITINPTAVVSGTQTLTGYRWNFGDGTTSAEPTPTHTYSKAGNYNVSLVFTTASGCTDSVVMVRAVRVG